MKDEEMAEEYVKGNETIYYHPNGVPIFTREEEMKFAFLAGLKAGRPQWHDLRENPNDLPNNRRNVWIVYLNGFYEKEETVASYRYKFWVISGHKTECDVIAWCEIPTFDKE